MPRRSKGPTLWLDKKRQQWVIRDGQRFKRTGFPAGEDKRAQQALASYIGKVLNFNPSGNPKIDEVLFAYLNEHAPTLSRPENAAHNIKNLNRWWSGKRVLDATARECRAYAVTRPISAARRDLETLRAAIGYWHQEYGPLDSIPKIVLPPRRPPRNRWLTGAEAKKLRLAASPTPHLYRFVVIGLLTGSRSSSILKLKWAWVDFNTGLMLRREPTEVEIKNKKYPVIKMGSALQRLLRRWHRVDAGKQEYVCHYENGPITKLRRSWGTALRRTNLSGKVSPHTLRHTKATWMMQAGVDKWEAAGYLGMSVQTLDRVYGHHHPEHQSNAAEVGGRSAARKTAPRAPR